MLSWAPSAPAAALAQLLRRLLRGLEAGGARRVWVMPDPYRLGEQAIGGLDGLSADVRFFDIPVTGTPADTIRAASAAAAAGVGALVVVGGDGTSRLAAKAAPGVPLLPLAWGTNNAFPWRVEAAVAGRAAALYARHAFPGAARRAKSWRIRRDGVERDLALIDVVRTDHGWAGSRALWEPGAMREVFLTRADPAATGLAALGGLLAVIGPDEPQGLFVRLAQPGEPGSTRALAHLMPGHFSPFAVEAWAVVPAGRRLPLAAGMLALDGERCVACDGGGWEIELSPDGPLVIDPAAVLRAWSAAGLALREEAAPDRLCAGKEPPAAAEARRPASEGGG